MSKLTCTDVIEALPGFALGALDVQERRDVAGHLETCAECQAQFRQYAEISHGLLNVVPQRIPPASLKRALMLAVETPPKSTLSRVRDFLTHPQAQPRWVWGTGLLATLAIVGLIVARNLDLTNQQSQLARQLHEQQVVSAVLSRSDNSSIAMLGTAEAKGATATLVFESQATTGVLLVHNLPRLPATQSYQLWLVDSTGKRDSGAVFNVQNDGSGTATLVVYAPRALQDYVKCGVSIEPFGGSPKPTGPAALTGSYS